jgi:hypothetical protein
MVKEKAGPALGTTLFLSVTLAASSREKEKELYHTRSEIIARAHRVHREERVRS